MSSMNVNQVLAQMRVLEAQAKAQTGPAQIGAANMGLETPPTNGVNGVQKTDFSEILANSINTVNDNAMNAGKMAKAFEQGDSNVSMAELMINMEKASVSFQAMTQVRNKLLNAYQEIMNMPV